MRSYEFAPGDAAPSADGPEATCPQPCTHGGRRHRNAKPLELADDTLISPPRVFSRQTQDQVSNLPPDPWPARTTRIGPTLRHQAPMPAQQRCRGDDEGSPTRPRQELARRRQEHAVDGRHRRTACLPSQNCELVPQHDDLQLLEVVRAPTQDGELENASKEEVTERKKHGSLRPESDATILRIGAQPAGLNVRPGRTRRRRLLHPSGDHKDRSQLWRARLPHQDSTLQVS